MKIGQRVVCIRDYSKMKHYNWEIMPIKGSIYTIREFVDDCLRLVEIRNELHHYDDGHYGECMFSISGFRPVDESFGEETAERIEEALKENIVPIEV